ncbi:MAG: SAM-dependent methyltransferase, partial [Alphaproteobacteria bacterium]|nr:SAM-dependent methyltransferase [Alphaproteobacteria bacterium]
GVFTFGHVGVEGLGELMRICRPGGIIVLTVKNTLWDAGFAERIAELEARGRISRLEETRPYASMPGETDTVPSRGLVLRVN